MMLNQIVWTVLLSASTASTRPNAPPSPPNAPSPTGAGNPGKPGDFKSTCASIASIASKLAVEDVQVQLAQFVAAGTNLSLPDNDPSCAQSSIVVTADICRIALSVSTSHRSSISMEAWLPSNWTGRFLSGGNGGLNGCIDYSNLAYTSSLGFSSVGTNNGHNGTSGEPFLNNPDVVADFAYRATHTGVVVGKAITQGFYGKKHKKSYYLGCSTGGRQGLKSAQDFPDDFDGLVVGAPAVAFNNLTSWSGHFYPITGPPGSPTFVTPAQWVQVHIEVLKQCDMLDGFADGILEDPLLCKFDPSDLACPAGTTDSSMCLTPTQVNTVRGVLAPLYDARGDLVFPALQPGAEIVGSYALFNGIPFPYTADWFRYVIYNDPTWDPTKINSTDYDNAARANPFNIETFEGDLSATQKRGSKIIHWHGGADFIITSNNSPRYYEHVSSTMGLSPSQLDDFYRLFRVSGTGHCGGGDGAHAIGQGIGEVNGYDAKQNVLMALVDWVENKHAPETLIGTKFVNDTQSLGIEFQRAHCKWPKRNHYKGVGNPNIVESWECVSP